MPHSLAVLALAPVSLALGTTLGCSAHVHGGGHSGPRIHHEVEPNDDAFRPDFVGTVWPASHFLIEGHVRAFGGDVLDGFAFVSSEPIEVHFELAAHNPYADLVISLYDPDLDAVVAVYDSPWDPEGGTFSVLHGGKEFHLIVESWNEPSSYTLELAGDFLHAAQHGGQAPGAASADLVFPAEVSAAPRAPLDAERYPRRNVPSAASEPRALPLGSPAVAIRIEAGGVRVERGFVTSRE